MGSKPAVLVGLCLCFSVTAADAAANLAAAQINMPNINPAVERRFELLRQKEANERMAARKQ